MSESPHKTHSPTAEPVAAACDIEETGWRAIIGPKTGTNILFWCAITMLLAVAVKESIAPSWVVHWSHPEWGSADVAPVMGIGVGLLAGFMGGMVGAFISLFSVPFYTLWLGLPIKVALGTNSLAAAVIGLFAALVHFQKKTPNMKIAGSMMVFGLLGAAVGAMISLNLPAKQLKMLFAILVFWAAAWMLYRAFIPKKVKEGKVVTEQKGALIAEGEWKGEKYRTNIIWPGVTNFFVAILAGILGVGGGFIFTPVLHAAFGLPMVVAVGTGNFVKVANIGSQFVVRGIADTVIYALAFFAMGGGYFGAMLGRRVGCVVDAKYLRLVFGISLIIVGLRWVGVKFW